MNLIELPWPDRKVFPNYRQSHHWRSFSAARKTQREEAHILTLAAKVIAPKEGRINLDVEFYPPDRRHRDDDGMVGAFKSARDGIADALGIDDRRFRPVYYFCEPVKGGKIIVRVESPHVDATQVGDALRLAHEREQAA